MTRAIRICFLILTFICTGSRISGQQIVIDSRAPTRPVFKAFPFSKIGEAASEALKIFMVQEKGISSTALLGDYSVQNDTVLFRPEFELEAGLSFKAVYHTKSGTATQTYRVPAAFSDVLKNITVKEIYPRSSRIPKNLLTFYVEFSAPMPENTFAYHFVNLYNSSNELIPHVWYERTRWINDRTMMVMIHPGRIKRGIAYFSELGPVFGKGKTYSLEVTSAVPKFQGSTLEPLIKEFKITKALTGIPRVLKHQLKIPKKNTLEKLKIVFNRPMDYFAALYGISVQENSTNSEVKGSIEPGSYDNEWYFTPVQPWSEKEYTILFGKMIIDLSGNSLSRPFETKKLKKKYDRTVKISFKPV